MGQLFSMDNINLDISSNSGVLWYEYGEDPASSITRLLMSVTRHRDGNFSDIAIVTPPACLSLEQFSKQVRRSLFVGMKPRGCCAILPPAIITLEQLCKTFRPASLPMGNSRLLLLFTLAEQLCASKFFSNLCHPVKLADILITLFHELTDYFIAQNCTQGIDTLFPSLESMLTEKDAMMVLSLWKIWWTTQSPIDIDEKTFYFRYLHEGLTNDITGNRRNGHAPIFSYFIFCGFSSMGFCERSFVRQLIAKGRAVLLLPTPNPHMTHGALKPSMLAFAQTLPIASVQGSCSEDVARNKGEDAEKNDFFGGIDLVFAKARPSIQACSEALQACFAHNPFSHRLTTFYPDNIHEHCLGVILKLLGWLAEGKSHLAIISTDQRFLQRLVALGKRFCLAFNIFSGAKLSTTSCAGILKTILERDTQTEAERMLLLLQLQGCRFPLSKENVRAVIRQLEKSHLQAPSHPSCSSASAHMNTVIRFIHSLPFGEVLGEDEAEETHTLDSYMESLWNTILGLDLEHHFAKDIAGKRILEYLQKAQHCGAAHKMTATYRFWKEWVLFGLSKINFMPPPVTHGISVLTPTQAGITKFDAAVVASFDSTHFPLISISNTPLNPFVLENIGIQKMGQQEQEQLYRIQSVLRCSSEFLLTCCTSEEDGEGQPSPWIHALEDCVQQAYGEDIVDHKLAEAARHAARDPSPQQIFCQANDITCKTQPTEDCDSQPLAPCPQYPFKTPPQKLSAATYQHLVDCPYLYYCHDILGLKDDEVILESARDKRNFGLALHKALYLLHERIHPPPPIKIPWKKNDRAALIGHLTERILPEAALQKQGDTLSFGSYWYRKLVAALTHYIDWIIELGEKKQLAKIEGESSRCVAITEDFLIYGKLDHIHVTQDGEMSIVDYKTTKLSGMEVETGEKVQLGVYALLVPTAQETSYLSFLLPEDRLQATVFHTDRLDALRQQHRTRLETIRKEFSKGGVLEAHGHPSICQSCLYRGICRREEWSIDVE